MELYIIYLINSLLVKYLKFWENKVNYYTNFFFIYYSKISQNLKFCYEISSVHNKFDYLHFSLLGSSLAESSFLS